MYLYNVTVKIDLEKHDDWLHWMRSVHIPDVMQTGMFVHYRLSKLLEQDESTGITYAIQYSCPNMGNYFTYQQEFAPKLQLQHNQRYQNHAVAFRTLLRVIDESE